MAAEDIARQPGPSRREGPLDTPARTTVVRADDGPVSVGIHGEGEPVLALHGLTANRGVWSPLARRAAEGTSLVAPDLPGRGRSPAAPSGRYRLRDELRRLRAALGELGIRPAVVVGHSQGAALAAALASTAPFVRGLVLCSPVCPWTPRPPLPRLLVRAAPVARRAVPALRRPVTRSVLRHRVYADPTRAGGKDVDRYAEPWADPDRAAELPRILADWNPSALWPYFPPPPVPVQVLVGRRDRRVPPRDAARLARAAAGELRVLRGAAHGVPEERPGAVAAALARVADEIGLDERSGSRRGSPGLTGDDGG